MHFQKYIVLLQVSRYYRPKERRLSPTPLIYHLSEGFQGVMKKMKRERERGREGERERGGERERERERGRERERQTDRSRCLKTDLFALGVKQDREGRERRQFVSIQPTVSRHSSVVQYV